MNWFSLFPYLLIIIGASARLLPHVPNFTPIAALALFGAAYLKKRDGLWVPLAAMLLSDAVIGFYHPLVMASVYGCFLLSGFIGIRLRRVATETSTAQTGEGFDKRPWMRVVGATLLGSIIFFIVTNWAVWAFGELYTKDLSGLIMSYWMGLPFFRNMLMGDLFYVALFFGIAELAPHLLRLPARSRSLVIEPASQGR